MSADRMPTRRGIAPLGDVPDGECRDGGRLTGFGSQQWEIDYNATTSGLNFTGDYLPVGSFVTVTAVPEPSTYAMALAVLACGGFSMRQRWRRA